MSVFARHVVDVPEKEQLVGPEIQRGPLLQPIVPPADPKSSEAEKLLDWLVNHWPKPVISVTDINQFGPRPLRNRNRAASQAEILAANGWLEPLKAHRRDRKIWRIAR